MPAPDTPAVLVLNGPNLNMLGRREPAVYGRQTLADIEEMAAREAASLGLAVEFRQSNSEADLIGWIHQAPGTYAAIVINAGAFSHTSVALRDALLIAGLPVVEVHISNIFKREAFRHHSYISAAARGMICGLGGKGYCLALEAVADILAGDRLSGDKTE